MARQEAKRRNKHEETDTMKEHHDSDGDDDISLSESPSRPDGRAEQEHRRLADVESKQICFWKTAVVGALVLAGTTVSLSVNMYLKNQQEKKIDQNVSTSFEGSGLVAPVSSPFILTGTLRTYSSTYLPKLWRTSPNGVLSPFLRR